MKYTMSEKVLKERTKFRVYCQCGHSMVMFPFEHRNKKICTHCGYYVYQNKKEEFKERLGLLL